MEFAELLDKCQKRVLALALRGQKPLGQSLVSAKARGVGIEIPRHLAKLVVLLEKALRIPTDNHHGKLAPGRLKSDQ